MSLLLDDFDKSIPDVCENPFFNMNINLIFCSKKRSRNH